IDAPHRFEVLDLFADENGEPAAGMPGQRMTFEFSATPTGTRMVTVSHFDSVGALEQVVAMGQVEGLKMAMAQIDAVLHDLREYAQGKGTRVELLGDTHVQITRLVDGPRELVWRAHTEEALMRQWMLGPDG